MDMMWYRRRGLMVTPHIETVTGAIASFNSDYNKIPIKSLICGIEPIQEGTGDPSPENVRPISGRTGLSVVRCGKNLIPTIFDGNLTKNGITFEVKPDGVHATGTATSTIYYNIVMRNNQSPILPAGTYTLSPTGVQQNNVDIRVAEIADQTIIAATKTSKTTFTITESKQYFCFFYIPNDTIFNDAVLTPQIEVGSIATAYEPYKGSTYSVNWETEAGTVYGGTLDVVSGKLTVDWISDDMGQYDWGGNNGLFSYTLHNVSPSWTRNSIDWMRCSTYKPESWNSIDYNTYSDYSIHGLAYNNVTIIRVYDSRYQTVADFKSGVSGTQFVYELATPIEIQLAPQEVRTLLCENNIWCDSGNVSVNYWKWGK